MHFPTEKCNILPRKKKRFPAEKYIFLHFPAEKCGFRGAHGRIPQEIVGGLRGSRIKNANFHKTNAPPPPGHPPPGIFNDKPTQSLPPCLRLPLHLSWAKQNPKRPPRLFTCLSRAWLSGFCRRDNVDLWWWNPLACRLHHIHIYICCKVKNWSKIWGFIS